METADEGPIVVTTGVCSGVQQRPHARALYHRDYPEV